MAATFYAQVLRDFDWPGLVRSLEPCGEQCYEGTHQVYLGSCLSLSPSGKYYTAFACSNVTETEAERDEAWWAALERAAEKHGLFVTSGEGDPTDIFVGRSCPKVDNPKVEEPDGQEREPDLSVVA